MRMKRGNGFGGVIKLGGKRRKPYAARVTQGWTTDGKQVVRYIGYYATKREATRALEAFNTNPYDLGAAKLTTLDVYEKWAQQQTLSESAFKTYASTFKKCSHLYKIPFTDLKLVDLEMGMELQSTTMKKAYRNLMINLYRYAQKYEITDKNLAEHLTFESFKSKERKIFTPQQIELLWNTKDNHPSGDVPLILLYTGVRINELLKLKSIDVHLDERYFVTGSKTDAGKNRKVPIHRHILPLIKKRLDVGTEYLITNKNGKRMTDAALRATDWQRVVNDVLRETYTPHETRHTFITHLNRVGVNKIIIQKIVGHASNDVTEHYTHTTLKELVDAVNKLKFE